MQSKRIAVVLFALSTAFVAACSDGSTEPARQAQHEVHAVNPVRFDILGDERVDLDDVGHYVDVTGPSVDWGTVPIVGSLFIPEGIGGAVCDSLRLLFYQAHDLFAEGWSDYWQGLLNLDFFGQMADGKAKMREGFRKMVELKQALEANSCLNPPQLRSPISE